VFSEYLIQIFPRPAPVFGMSPLAREEDKRGPVQKAEIAGLMPIHYSNSVGRLDIDALKAVVRFPAACEKPVLICGEHSMRYQHVPCDVLKTSGLQT
jgi:hypothetical protein